MQNDSLVKDYIVRARDRLDALDLFFNKESWANVVRESQEIVELVLKALLRHCRIESPRIHDVGGVLMAERDRLPKTIQEELEKIVEISKDLRRDRELAFYGSEDLTPSEFYSKKDASEARAAANFVTKIVAETVGVS